MNYVNGKIRGVEWKCFFFQVCISIDSLEKTCILKKTGLPSPMNAIFELLYCSKIEKIRMRFDLDEIWYTA